VGVHFHDFSGQPGAAGALGGLDRGVRCPRCPRTHLLPRARPGYRQQLPPRLPQELPLRVQLPKQPQLTATPSNPGKLFLTQPLMVGLDDLRGLFQPMTL